MYIKRIVIQGFKTYKNATIIDEISPHHNVVVGRNGSGKSNFFAAIRFVLSDAYTHMSRGERQSLIHEGSGTVMSAYVEIIFDNTDRRFPISKDEISIRRTIGLKKDDYSLDNKSATRSDVMNLLESAGFSRSNPYYIVPQGRITSLTNSKDSERLTLLKEVSGARVFENKLKESVKEMTNSNFKIQRIDETLSSIGDRISDLQIESNDLKEFQSLEKSKKVLEYNLFDREVSEINGQLDVIEVEHNEMLDETKQDMEELKKRERVCQALKQNINEKKINLKVIGIDREQTQRDYHVLLKNVTDKRVSLEEARSNIAMGEKRKSEVNEARSKYESLICSHEAQIAKFKPDVDRLSSIEKELKESLSAKIARQRAIYSKRNRFSKFKSKSERDRWLKSKIDENQKSLEERIHSQGTLKLTSEGIRKRIFEINNEMEQVKHLLSDENYLSELQKIQADIYTLNEEVISLTDERKSLWRDEIKLKGQLDSLSEGLDNAEHIVNSTMDRAQSKGITAVKSIAQRLKIESSLYGMVADLFQVNEKYRTAVEVVAGNSLFHIVVDNDKTASLIMEELRRTSQGRVTFMPLNRLSYVSVEYPDSVENQCVPLMKKLKYTDEAISPALSQIFSRTIVCGDLQKGSELARRYKLNAVTLDGDSADQSGVLTGGFRNYKTSRLEALNARSKMRTEFLKLQESVKSTNQSIALINDRLLSLNNNIKVKKGDLENLKSKKEPLESKLSKLDGERVRLEEELDGLVSDSEHMKSLIDVLTNKIDDFKEELKSKFSSSLSAEDEEQLRVLRIEISNEETKLTETVTELAELETEISKYDAELNDNFKPHLKRIIQEGSFNTSSIEEFKLKELEKDLEYSEIKLDSVQSKLKQISDSYNSLSDDITSEENSLRNADDQQASILKKLDGFSKNFEKILSKKAYLSARRTEVDQKIRELGILPEEAFQKSTYDNFSSDELAQRLSVVNDKLLKYSHINKKALEQYQSFTKQQDDLIKRREELESSRESIEQLIMSLKTQKDEAIAKSFKQVAKSFNEIFEKLVPLGVGNLIMQKKSISEASQSGAVQLSALGANSNIDDYIGVAISASFNSKSDEQQRIEQLSGGQKSLCAISLILAIQSCDPAPFYLFDEIDANLDTQYRTAVASLIKSLSSNAQFICTTFRPEMLQVADKFYGVMFNNKVSSVSEINKEDATSFIEGTQTN